MQRGRIEKKCEVCKSVFRTHPYMIRKGFGKYCSSKCYGVAKSGIPATEAQLRGLEHGRIKGRVSTQKNEKHPAWKGDEASYVSIHHWLKRNFGKADRCENKRCLGRSTYFDWAKIHGTEYVHLRENFVRLCKSCHKRYDSFTIEIVV